MNGQNRKNSASSPNFSLAFQQMASFVAIAKTRDFNEILDELVQQCFVVLPNEPFSTPLNITEAIHALFGIKLAEKDVTFCIRRLNERKSLITLQGGQMGLSQEVAQNLMARIADARRLEENVKTTWLKQIHSHKPSLGAEKLWIVLRDYLAKAFRRHGIQAIALMDPTSDLAREQMGSLSSILESVVREHFDEGQRHGAREAVSSFVSTVPSDRKRAEYIAQLADGAFNYFSLTVAPEVSEKLRSKINPLTLFLDTNFLFGILNLHVNPQVDVSAELLEAIQQFKLPFRLRYHDATSREMTNTLHYFGSELSKQTWPQHISRAAVKSEALSGIELRYHHKNADQHIEVEDFLSPYLHWELLLRERNIDIYRVDSSEERLLTRANLEADYKDFLAKVRRDKPLEAIQHDMAVLETVRSLRSNGKNTLDAGVILVTCDYHLCRFDWESSRKERRPGCAMLPSLLWQILRPFISDSQGIDQAFAATFALPEFAMTRGGAERAASRMLSILAGYKDIPEETAVKMLADDLLLADLQSKKNEDEFARAIESAIAKENASLFEEKAALERQLAGEKQEREARESQLHEATKTLQEKQKELADQIQALQKKERTIRTFAESSQQHTHRAREAEILMQTAMMEKKQVEAHAKELLKKIDLSERKATLTAKIASIAISLLVVLLFHLMVHSIFRWDWLLSNPNSYGIQGCISFMLFFGIMGLGVKTWRKALWVVGLFGVLFVALQLLGGPIENP